MTRILLYGLQRSGTNFIEQTVLRNFDAVFLNSDEHRDAPIQKHFRLYDDKSRIWPKAYVNDLVFEDFAAFERNLDETPDVYLVISKDPYSWVLSYQSWAKKCKWPPPQFHCAEEWDAFYAKWLEFGQQSDRIVFIRYLDLLENMEGVLETLATRAGLNRIVDPNEGLHAPQQVPQSGAFTESKRRYYLEARYFEKFSDEELSAINAVVSDNTLKGLGYERRLSVDSH